MHETRVSRADVEHLLFNIQSMTLAERMGKETKQGIEIPLRLSRQEIADLVGTTVESAIRVLSRWGHEKIVITGEERFVIPSREKLHAITTSPPSRG